MVLVLSARVGVRDVRDPAPLEAAFEREGKPVFCNAPAAELGLARLADEEREMRPMSGDGFRCEVVLLV